MQSCNYVSSVSTLFSEALLMFKASEDGKSVKRINNFYYSNAFELRLSFFFRNRIEIAISDGKSIESSSRIITIR